MKKSLILFAAIASLFASGCGRCVVERATVGALSIAAEAADDAMSEHRDDRWEKALNAVQESVELGWNFVDSCEAVRDREVFARWAEIALDATSHIIALLKEFDVEIPFYLSKAIELLNRVIPYIPDSL